MNIEKFVKEDMGIRVKCLEGELSFSLEDLAKGIGLVNKRDNSIRFDRVKDYVLNIYENCSEKIPPELVELEPNTFVYNRYIEEHIMYLLLMKGKSEKAIEFQVWVAKEVLPSLRKNNFYINEKQIDSSQINELEKKVKTLRIAKGILHEIVYDISDATTMSFTEASKKLFGKNAKYLKTKLKEEGFIDSDGKVLIKKAEFTKPDNSKEMLRIFTNTNVEKCREVDDIKYSKITNFGYLYLKKHFNKKGFSNFKFNYEEQ